MNNGSIDALKGLDGEAKILGLRRLGAVYSTSLKIQHLSTRDVENLTYRWFGMRLNKDTSSKLNRGNTNPSMATLNRMAPFWFKVSAFEVSDSNPVGIPIFTYNDFDYASKLSRVNLEFTLRVEDLPDLDYRYSHASQLFKIIKGEIPVKRLLNRLPNH